MDSTHDVEYSEPDDLVCGHKVSDDREAKITPSYTQVNEHNGEQEERVRHKTAKKLKLLMSRIW